MSSRHKSKSPEGSSNNVSMMSPKELAALGEFKGKIHDLLKPSYSDHYLLKWLKARNFDVGKAETMFRNSMAYRTKMKVDTLLRDYSPPEVLRKYMPGGFCGFDKEGSPVLVELYGYTDMKGILHSVKKSDIEKTKLLLGERVMRILDTQTQKLGHPVDGMTVIIDMDNVGASFLWVPGIQMYAHMGKVLQDNYPEIVKRSFIVNAPRIFPMLWRMFRPLVTEEMKKKVCILGGGYKKELLKHIEADQLPKFLGGNLTDPDGDPRCPSKILQGGTVPESYFLTELARTDNMETLSVPRGDRSELRFPVHQPGSILRWEFKTDGYDVGFGVYLETVSGRENLLSVERVNSHMVPEDGTYICQRPGTYLTVFDNSYSWARGKTVYYNIDVVPPDDVTTMSDLDQVTQGGSWERIADETLTTRL